MISDRVSSMLVEQVGSELTAHQTYLGISIHFERHSLKRWAALFRAQAIEEAGHGEKIMAFLIDNEVSFDLPAMHGATTHYTDATEALEAALASEVRVSGQFDAMAEAARAEGDHRSFQFLQWFIDEQVEEERTIRGLLDLVNSGINLFQAEPLLDVEGD
ncbi:MAG TPA: ferritin [Candidatus Limnocylindrales bacterium]|nr:ferritin [Candidatus Limnocylindrales bacterium]